jgi:tRNA(Arg) A34 adenosine deaminase TadA
MVTLLAGEPEPAATLYLHPGAYVTQELLMREAARLALENVRTATGGPFGAIVAREGEIVARGVNTVTRDNDPTAHAEVNVIRAAGRVLGTFDLSGCQIYASCEPCPMCLAAIYWAKIDRVYFGCTADDAAEIGFADAFIYQELRLPRAERELKLIELEREACLLAFRTWERSGGKVSY